MLASKYADPLPAASSDEPHQDPSSRAATSEFADPTQDNTVHSSKSKESQATTALKSTDFSWADDAEAEHVSHHISSSDADMDQVCGMSPLEESASSLPHGAADSATRNALPGPTVVTKESASSVEPAPTGEGSATFSLTEAPLWSSISSTPSITATASTGLDTDIDMGTARKVEVKKFRSRRGKTCAVRIPQDQMKTYSGTPTPLTEAEVRTRLEAFGLYNHDTMDHSQACAMFPDPQEQQEAFKARRFNVSVPEREGWYAYVSRLREEKLRRLGVSSVDDSPEPHVSRRLSSPERSPERRMRHAQYYPGEYAEELAKIPPSGQLDWTGLGAGKVLGFRATPPKTSPAHHTGFSRTFAPAMDPNFAAKEFHFDTQKAQHSKRDSLGFSNFNVIAPEFKPPTQTTFAFASAAFNFAKKSHLRSIEQESTVDASFKDEQDTSSAAARIFGGMPEFIKPGKKSKAIPIVRPGSAGLSGTKDASNEEQEDEDGRIERSDERRKRGRRNEGDGDEVPRFAEPSTEPFTEPILQIEAAINRVNSTSPSEVANLEKKQLAQVSQSELQRHMREDLVIMHGRRPLELEFDIDGELTDTSEILWHGVDGKQAASDSIRDVSVATSPALQSANSRLAASLRGDATSESSTARDSLSSMPLGRDLGEEAMYPAFQGAGDIADYINNDNSDFGIDDAKPYNQQKMYSDALSDEDDPPTVRMDLRSTTQVGDRCESETGTSRDAPSKDCVEQTLCLANDTTEKPISDWDDMLSSGKELFVPAKHRSIDSQTVVLLEGLLRRHLTPVEKTLKDLGSTINKQDARTISRAFPAQSAPDKSNSDADDESEADELSTLSKRGVRSQQRLSQIRLAVKEAINSIPPSGLEQVEQEAKLRKAAEQRADDLQRLLTITEKEITLYKESVANQDDKIRSLVEEREDAVQRYADAEEELRTKTLNFTAEIAKLENELDDHRASTGTWQEDLRLAEDTREHLQDTILRLKLEAAEILEDRNGHRRKVVVIDEELKKVSASFTNERQLWQSTEEQRIRECQELEQQLREAHDLKHKWGAEVESLGEKEQEATSAAIRTKVLLEEAQKAKAGLEAEVIKLNDQAIEHATIVARYEREASEARENILIEVQRTKAMLQADVEIANKRVENVNADLETRLEIANSQLESVKKDHDAMHDRYERSLDESSVARKDAMLEMNTIHSRRLQEEKERFDQVLEEVSQRHDRAIHDVHEDKHRSDNHWRSQLELANDRIAFLHDRIAHLEESLTVARQAAAAAARFAKSSQVDAADEHTSSSSRSISTPSHLEKVSPQALRESIVVLQEQLQEREARIEHLQSTASKTENTSPIKMQQKEAEIGWLREVLNVRVDDLTDLVNSLLLDKFDRGAARNAAIRIRTSLQMQLQEREGRPDAVKSASQSPVIPTLTDLQNFASPKAAQFAAAFGSWRRNPPTLAAMREAEMRKARNAATPIRRVATSTRASPANPEVLETPAPASAPSTLRSTNLIAAGAVSNGRKGSDANSFLSDLMTPPATTLRHTPSIPAKPPALQTQSVPNAARPRTPDRKVPRQGAVTPASASPAKRVYAEPSTPELTRRGAYDLDAELGGRDLYGEDEETEQEESPSKVRQRKDSVVDAVAA